ncbi:uncharacterized protein [Physcomitrium patens]|uniref:RWD domain-containing protein n=1 Tax=Physcomitrium patens TaxID=3218 RepID=A0A2K1KJ71_PHYPA|nr:RWD domain-containing protein 4-like [Physcomitrium patens]XP_024374895.1 RWD domain-containing protein 4-like [Physcomitrium patens]XP_024374896.1 RWD domain-containing protein 4-like [Physcomitrium patens]XP_024374897.1 RWD domain-containing protein 4-like [Physcomitrium patens]PNR53819.1 hypothetical protein PHYPA_007494 [Physcomitrium patens]|eukprot:XP_024374894.1 RWD domain-containing protein 4-like [Physcomitrella patens]
MEDVIEEEMMALEAIFYDSYSKINDNSFRIRIDSDVEEDAPPAFFLEFQLPKGYPDEIPKFDLSNINNSKYPEAVKAAILEGLHEQAEEQKGESMCYNLVDWLKEKLPHFYRLKPVVTTQESDHSDSEHHQAVGGGKKGALGKDKMTKAQKRRHFDKYGAGAEKPRGWDWVPILSHLGQVPHIPSA